MKNLNKKCFTFYESLWYPDKADMFNIFAICKNKLANIYLNTQMRFLLKNRVSVSKNSVDFNEILRIFFVM